ncbi:hypothetical protein [Desulfonatronospira sp.]|uniref:hypothetical protein n=1 Tax=Desulfonatronospira sp. TaxID=1962951 RepID=UPI0025C67AFB|nr:hypothetical protein [Desulfonatronospira sp.]
MKKRGKKTKKVSKSSIKKPPLASRVVNALQKNGQRKVVDIQEFRNAKMIAEELEQTVIKIEDMEKLDPLHAVYVYAQNKMSVIMDQLSDLPALDKLTDLYEDAREQYMPGGPPMSPLTLSYFFCWGFFDLNVGNQRESLGFVATEVCKELKADEGQIRAFEAMNSSRMGLYVHEGFSGQGDLLREFVTGNRIKVKVPSGHKGQPGEIWLVRLLPPLFPEMGLDYSVVFTTPYVIGKLKGKTFSMVGDEQGWEEYFERTLDKVQAKDKLEAYEKLMKYGLSRHYWNEYIFEAFFNYTKEAIMLTGFPDIPLSRPFSKESQEQDDID